MTTRPHQVFEDLARLGALLSQDIDTRLREECDLSLNGFRVLLTASGRAPFCRVQEVADALALSVGGASQAVDRLERRGLCVRRSNPRDRRSSLVDVTPAGHGLLDDATLVYADALDSLVGTPLAEPELGELARLLGVLRASVGPESRLTPAG
ncbi:MarR family winged helix-turn-helix transcriptional regulator [Streptomyces sp. NPDC001422]|uniref:MarR family winged helix-turn-helix transcriptional regulator n=1 Tax=Streptomyces sp. NPDC001422 TaxID=3364575 RepID=UPI0036BD61A5